MTVRLVHYSDIEHAFDSPEKIGSIAETIRDLNGDDAVVVGSGDNTSPGVLSLVTRGEQSLPFFDAIDADFDTFGNHDFDHGLDNIRQIIDRTPQTWVSTNVTDRGDRFGAAEGVVPYAIRTVSGVRLGFFGLSHPETSAINPAAAELSFDDPITAAKSAVEQLRDAGADFVICLSHLGEGDDQLAREVDVDVILGGHEHRTCCKRISGTLLTKPTVGGDVVWEIELPEMLAKKHIVDDDVIDATVAETVLEIKRDAGLTTVITELDVPISRTTETIFGGECRVGNFVTDAYRWKTGAAVALQNSGGIRSGPPLEREVTRGDLIGLVPFNEPLVVVEVDDRTVRSLLTEVVDDSAGTQPGPSIAGHISGASIRYTDDGEVIECTVGEAPIDPERTYSVATSEYVLRTDHEFGSISKSHLQETYGCQYEAIVDYARRRGIESTVDGRLQTVDSSHPRQHLEYTP